MVKARTWFTLFIVSLGTVAATASCGSDEATGGPAGGASGVGGGSIISGAGRAGGSVGRAGASTGGGPSTGSSTIGLECASDAECGDGMVCATTKSTLLGNGGPSNGMCTMACTTPADCDAVEPGASCFNFGTSAAPQRYCLAPCDQGDTPAGAPGKCQVRQDLACVDLRNPDLTDTPIPFCVPQCISDADCGSGLYCDKGRKLGLCTKTKPVGDPVGTPCDPNATTDTCKGFCLTSSDDSIQPACAEFCTGGTPCLYSGTTPGGFCIGPLSSTWGVGDIGFCEATCSCTSDCAYGDLCRKWAADETDLAGLLASDGLCYGILADSVELTCGEGGASGAGGAGSEAGASGEGGVGAVTPSGGASGTSGTSGTAGTSGTSGTGGN